VGLPARSSPVTSDFAWRTRGRVSARGARRIDVLVTDAATMAPHARSMFSDAAFAAATGHGAEPGPRRSSAQRWFRGGFDSGDARQCDTFAVVAHTPSCELFEGGVRGGRLRKAGGAGTTQGSTERRRRCAGTGWLASGRLP
jgi:hypothetical protein